jgi:hypothetical protein
MATSSSLTRRNRVTASSSTRVRRPRIPQRTASLHRIDEARPYLTGEGPTVFPTTTAVVPAHPICWDVNGYYRELGVDPRATKAQLRQAYQDAGGPDSARLTYVLCQLLDPEIRAAYDRMPLGSKLTDDYVLQELLEVAAVRTFGKSNEVLTGILNMPLKDRLLLDNAISLGKPGGTRSQDFGYSYYLYRTAITETDRLWKWQLLLVGAARQLQIDLSVAVGFHGAHEAPWIVRRVGYRDVLFLHETHEPTPEDATDALNSLISTDSTQKAIPA